MNALEPAAPNVDEGIQRQCSAENRGSPYIRATVTGAPYRPAVTSPSSDKPAPSKTKNESRQIEYIRKLSMHRQMQMEQEEAERARVNRMRRTAREAVARRAQELSPTRKLSHSLSVPPTSTTQTPPIAGNPRRQQRSSSTSRITHKGSLDLPPCDRAGTKSDESTAPQSPPKGYHKYTERLQAYIRSQSLKQPLELISSGAVTKEDRKQRQEQWRAGFERWKSSSGIPPDGKVFIIRGGYPYIRKALIERGWHENKDVDSDFFDYKWTLKTKHVHRYR